MSVRDDILATIAAMSADAAPQCEEEIRERLIAQGNSLLRAEILGAFIPLAFGRAWTSSLDVNGPHEFSETAMIWCGGKDYREIKLSDVPEYSEALAIAEEALRTESMPWED